MDFQGSLGGCAPPFCSSSIEMRSGERTKAMRPSRGGRAIVTPPSCRRLQVAPGFPGVSRVALSRAGEGLLAASSPISVGRRRKMTAWAVEKYLRYRGRRVNNPNAASYPFFQCWRSSCGVVYRSQAALSYCQGVSICPISRFSGKMRRRSCLE